MNYSVLANRKPESERKRIIINCHAFYMRMNNGHAVSRMSYTIIHCTIIQSCRKQHIGSPITIWVYRLELYYTDVGDLKSEM